MTVRSAVLGRIQVPTANVFFTIGTVPAGQTWLLKQLNFVGGSATAANVIVDAADQTATLFARWIPAPIAFGKAAEISTSLVLVPGDFIRVQSDQVGTWFWVSGSKLSGVA